MVIVAFVTKSVILFPTGVTVKLASEPIQTIVLEGGVSIDIVSEVTTALVLD